MNSLIHVVVIFLQQYMEFSLNMTIFIPMGQDEISFRHSVRFSCVRWPSLSDKLLLTWSELLIFITRGTQSKGRTRVKINTFKVKLFSQNTRYLLCTFPFLNRGWWWGNCAVREGVRSRKSSFSSVLRLCLLLKSLLLSITYRLCFLFKGYNKDWIMIK